jgi:hypothetical protein
MLKNFKKGFNGDYRVTLTPGQFRTFCEIDWPAFGVGWPSEESLDKVTVNRTEPFWVSLFEFLNACRGAWTPRSVSSY